MHNGDVPRICYRTAFTVYDGRHHVLGASMLSDVDDQLRVTWPVDTGASCTVQRAKFLNKTGCDGDMTVQRGGALRDIPKDAAFSVVGQYGGEPFQSWFVPDAKTPVGRRAETEHQFGSIEPVGDFGGRCHILVDRRDHFLLALVDANKHVQLATLPLQNQRWVGELVSIERYTMQPVRFPVASALEIENRANRTSSGRIFTLNRLHFTDSLGSPQVIEMGFSFYPQ